MRRCLFASAGLLLLLASPAAAETWPSGEPVPDAAVVDITPGGFDAVTDVIPALLPEGIELDTIGDGYEGALGQCWLGGYEYEVSNLWIDLSVGQTTLTPRDGYLELDLDIDIQINEAADPFYVFTMLECIEDTCDAWVEPFTVSASTFIDLRVVEGPDGLPALDANVGDVSVDYTLTGDQINLDGCVIGTINDVLDFFGFNLFDIVLSFAGGFIDDAIAGFVPEIEALIEDAASGLYIEQELDLGGAVANLVLYPEEIRIREEGMRLALGGLVDAGEEPAACVADVDPGGSYYLASDTPEIGSGPGTHHAGIFLSDEFGNQALYALWRAGLLCQVVDSELTGGFALDTNILGLVAGEAFDPVFESPQPLLIETRPDKAPTLEYNGENDVGVRADALGLEFYAEMDHRQARVLGVDVDALVGVDLPFDGATGELAAAINISGDNVTTTVTHNEFAPDASADIESNFGGLFDTLVGPILGGLVGDSLSFALPSIEGIGLTGLSIDAAGDSSDWLGVYADIGVTPYAGAGCDDESGGCDAGCGAVGPSPGRLALLGLPLLVVGLRRRQS